MTALLLVAQLATSTPGVDCSLLTPQQAQGLPCAVAPRTTVALPPAPQPPPEPTQPVVVGFRPGATYQRDATGVRIHISGLGALKNGIAVVSAECLTESAQDQCYFAGQGRFILANATTQGWTEQP